jgi:hypothetical protein
MFSIFWREDAILLFLKCSGFFFESRLVLLVLLMLMNQVACRHDFEASKENHVDEFVAVEGLSLIRRCGIVSVWASILVRP